MSKVLKFILSLVLTLGAGAIGSLATTKAIPTWYAIINKPSFNPPNWIFAPVWTTLFILMGIAFYLVWTQTRKHKEVKFALNVFVIQLIFNILWSVIFFGLKLPGLAFLDIIILWIAILFTIIKFNKISRAASYLLIPYLIWVSFASILNFSIWQLN